MAEIFVSHSSKDEIFTNRIEDWLERGFSGRFFLDRRTDESGIIASERWRDSLRRAKQHCRVSLFLITPNWLASPWCYAEYEAAGLMGKRRLVLLDVPDPTQMDKAAQDKLRAVQAEEQIVRAADTDWEKRVTLAFELAGLAGTIFQINTEVRNEPYPGLSAFGEHDADAAIFFGRDLEIGEVLDRLRSWRRMEAEATNTATRPFLIVGASGSGKSSLMRAGVLTRLRREGPSWIVLPPLRPGRDPLASLAESISVLLSRPGVMISAGEIAKQLKAHSPEEAVRTIALRIRESSAKANGVIVLPVDQAEELLNDKAANLDRFVALMKAMTKVSPRWLPIMTLRSDSLAQFQASPRFNDMPAHQTFDLRPLVRERFADIIEEPAKRYGVEVEPALTEELIRQTPNSDALPLLAFALQRLWRARKNSAPLSVTDMPDGGIASIVSTAAERALYSIGPDSAAPVPGHEPPPSRVAAALSCFLPRLVRINKAGQPVRRVARTSSFVTADERAVIDDMIAWRLLTTRETEIEVTHEAIFRAWKRFNNDWLPTERTNLALVEEVAYAAAEWDASGRKPERLLHRGDGLKRVRRLVQERPDYREVLERHDIDADIRNDKPVGETQSIGQSYLNACSVRQTTIRGILVGGLVAAAAVAGWVPVQLEAGAQSQRLFQRAAGLQAEQSFEAASVLAITASRAPDFWLFVDAASGRKFFSDTGMDRVMTGDEIARVARIEMAASEYGEYVSDAFPNAAEKREMLQSAGDAQVCDSDGARCVSLGGISRHGVEYRVFLKANALELIRSDHPSQPLAAIDLSGLKAESLTVPPEKTPVEGEFADLFQPDSNASLFSPASFAWSPDGCCFAAIDESLVLVVRVSSDNFSLPRLVDMGNEPVGIFWIGPNELAVVGRTHTQRLVVDGQSLRAERHKGDPLAASLGVAYHHATGVGFIAETGGIYSFRFVDGSARKTPIEFDSSYRMIIAPDQSAVAVVSRNRLLGFSLESDYIAINAPHMWSDDPGVEFVRADLQSVMIVRQSLKQQRPLVYTMSRGSEPSLRQLEDKACTAIGSLLEPGAKMTELRMQVQDVAPRYTERVTSLCGAPGSVQ